MWPCYMIVIFDEFLKQPYLFSLWSNLDSEVNRLNYDLESSENSLRDVKKILANSVPEMLPPKVFQNKVTIYPVRLD